MALQLMTDEELQNIGINDQMDKGLDLDSGIFEKAGWVYNGLDVQEDATDIVRKYVNLRINATVYVVSKKTSSSFFTGNNYSIYKFYKEV